MNKHLFDVGQVDGWLISSRNSALKLVATVGASEVYGVNVIWASKKWFHFSRFETQTRCLIYPTELLIYVTIIVDIVPQIDELRHIRITKHSKNWIGHHSSTSSNGHIPTVDRWTPGNAGPKKQTKRPDGAAATGRVSWKFGSGNSSLSKWLFEKKNRWSAQRFYNMVKLQVPCVFLLKLSLNYPCVVR